MVGVKRLELSTPCTPCKCASQLRHTPIVIKSGAKIHTKCETPKIFDF